MTSYIPRFALLLALMFTAGSMAVVVNPEEAQAQKRKKKKTKSVKAIGGVKGGFILSGSGETEAEINGTKVEAASVEFDDESTYGLNGFALFPVSKTVRVGGSIWAFPAVDFKAKNSTGSTSSDDKSFGLDLNLLGEYVMPLGQVDGFAYGEGGFSMIMPPDAEEGQTQIENYLGYNVGGGVGAQYLASKKLALRGDVKATYYSVTSTTTEGSNESKLTLTGTRFMVNVGIAFGL